MASSSGWTPMFDERRRADEREQFAGNRRRPQARHQFVVGQRAGLEEFLHQLFVGFGHHLDERFARRVDRCRHVGRDRRFCELAALVGLEDERLAGDQIDDAAEGLLFADAAAGSESRSGDRTRAATAASARGSRARDRSGSARPCAAARAPRPPPRPSRSAPSRPTRRRRRPAPLRRPAAPRARRSGSCRCPACR